MARQIRIQYPGAIYHIMARGDRKEPIVINDGDRRAFVGTLGEMCERTGIRIYAFALLDNHYHLVLVTPEGNLVKGMSWFQNTYTRRFNTCHNLWGHLFGGRYKAVLVEPGGNYFRRVIDYVHLNPVRAGLASLEYGIHLYPWCSLRLLLNSCENRPNWLDSNAVFSALGLEDTPAGRLAYHHNLERIIRQEGVSRAGRVDAKSTPGESLQATIRRGWYFGSEQFKERMLDLMGRLPDHTRQKIEDGYYGDQPRDHGINEARNIIASSCGLWGISFEELRSRKRNNPEKVFLSEIIASQTSVSLDWLRAELSLGSRGYASRLINQQRRILLQDAELRVKRDLLLKNVKSI